MAGVPDRQSARPRRRASGLAEQAVRACSRCHPITSSCSGDDPAPVFDPVRRPARDAAPRACPSAGGDSRVADQHVVKLQRRLAEIRAGVRFDQPSPALRASIRAEVHARVWPQGMGDGSTRSCRPTTAARRARCALRNRAARCGQRGSAWMVGESRDRRARHRRPSAPLAPEGAARSRACAPARRGRAGCLHWLARTRPVTADGNVSAPTTLAASRVAARASSPVEADHVVHQTAADGQRQLRPSRSGRAAPRTSSGAAVHRTEVLGEIEQRGSAHCRSSIASTTGCCAPVRRGGVG